MTTQETQGLLSSPECMRILKEAEIQAMLLTGIGGTIVALYGDDGAFLFRVHKDINASDLRTMLHMHKSRFESGFQTGRESAFAQLRALIGAAGV